MKTEHQIKAEATALARQARPLRDINPRAYEMLAQRIATLSWVLGSPNVPRTLSLTKTELDTLEGLF